MQTNNSFKFFDIVGHQCHFSRAGQTCYEEVIRTNWHSFLFKLSTNNCRFYGRGTIQVNSKLASGFLPGFKQQCCFLGKTKLKKGEVFPIFSTYTKGSKAAHRWEDVHIAPRINSPAADTECPDQFCESGG